MGGGARFARVNCPCLLDKPQLIPIRSTAPTANMASALAAYRNQVVQAHRPAFDLFNAVAVAIEDAIGRPRRHPEVVDVVLDMLMLQAYKSYSGIALLAQHGLMEDTATIVRRLLEIGVQSVYIGAEHDPRQRRRKAGQYLAFMWRQLPARLRRRLPAEARARWSASARAYGRFVPSKAKRWGPNWRTMFREVGLTALYDADYAFLSGIAHGRPDNQLFTFASKRIRIVTDAFVTVLLVYATRYYLGVAFEWNRQFALVPSSDLAALVQRANVFPTHGAV